MGAGDAVKAFVEVSGANRPWSASLEVKTSGYTVSFDISSLSVDYSIYI